MLDPVENSMTTSAQSKASLHGQIAPLMTLASATAAVRVGTLAALIPGLVAAHVGTGTWLTLALHIAGALATVVVILVQSRVGLLIAVLFTGYSTVVLALNAPNGALSSVMWIVGGLTLLMTLASSLTVRRKQNLLWPVWTALLGVIVGFVVLSILR